MKHELFHERKTQVEVDEGLTEETNEAIFKTVRYLLGRLDAHLTAGSTTPEVESIAPEKAEKTEKLVLENVANDSAVELAPIANDH